MVETTWNIHFQLSSSYGLGVKVFEEMFTNYHSIDESIKDEGVCRTAPAT